MTASAWSSCSLGLFVLVLVASGCASEPQAKPADCDETCRHNTALRGLRETMKVVYNLTLQGKPVGAQDASVGCPMGGDARVFGEATSNAFQGATEVALTYVFERCRYLQRDEEPPENYDLTLSGVVSQAGTLAAQPSATTALVIRSDAVDLTGSVFDPAIRFVLSDCAVMLGQNGNLLSGTLCEHVVGVDL